VGCPRSRVGGRVQGRVLDMRDRRILALDAADGLSLALMEGEALLAAWEWRQPRSAGTRVLAWVEEARRTFGPPECIAVGLGPGSFTGVRVAVTAAKTLAWGFGCPLYGASSLQALAAAVANAPSTVVASAERRRSHVFLGVYFRGHEGAEVLLPDRRWMLPTVPEVLGRAEDPVLVAGPLAGDAAFVRALKARPVKAAVVRPAEGLVRLVWGGVAVAVDPRTVEPNYLREPLAQATPRGELEPE